MEQGATGHGVGLMSGGRPAPGLSRTARPPERLLGDYLWGGSDARLTGRIVGHSKARASSCCFTQLTGDRRQNPAEV